MLWLGAALRTKRTMTPDQRKPNLTDSDVGQYKEAGYTTVPGFFAPGIAALRVVDRWVVAGLPRD